MDKKYICYCGLYCENCATKAKVEPAAKVLYEVMKQAGFDEIIGFMPNGEPFWAFLKDMAENGTCVSCKDGSGNPGCEIRTCAREKGVEACAFCESFPCDMEFFKELLSNYPVLASDNKLLREQGLEAWGRLQDERRAKDFTYVPMAEIAD
jgi:hypothetical protein